MSDSGRQEVLLTPPSAVISRNGQSALRDIVSVMDYGAKGDGVTDDTAAVQAAITSLNAGGGLFFPPGTYLLGGAGVNGAAVAVNANDITLFGVGTASKLKIAAGVNLNLVRFNTTADGTGATRLSRGAIRDLLFDQTGSTAAGGGLAGCVSAFAMDHFDVRGCYFLGSQGVGLNIQASNYVRVVDNVVDTVTWSGGGNGINVVGTSAIANNVTDFAVIGNTIIDASGDGILVQGNKANRAVVSGNVVRQLNNIATSGGGSTPFYGIAVEAIPANPASEVAITGNSVYGKNSAGTIILKYGIFVNNAAGTNTGPAMSRTAITGNVVRGATTYGIQANDNQVNITGNEVYDCSSGILWGQGSNFTQIDVAITGNVVNAGTAAGGNAGIAISKAINTAFARRISVTGNTIDGSGGVLTNGILVQGTLTDFVIAGNVVAGSCLQSAIVVNKNQGALARGVIANNVVSDAGGGGSGSAFNRAGIAIIGAADSIKITGNISTQGTAATQLYGVYLDPVATNVTVSGNDLRGNATAAVNATPSAANAQVLRNNEGYNPQGGAIATPAVPATTVAATNGTGVDVTVHLTGGAVTVVAVAGTATGLTAGTFRVAAGSTIAITYTVVPTWVWVGD